MRIPVVLVALRVVVVQSSSTTTKTTTTTTTRASLALESCAFFSLGMGCKISKNSFYQNPQIQKELVFKVTGSRCCKKTQATIGKERTQKDVHTRRRRQKRDDDDDDDDDGRALLFVGTRRLGFILLSSLEPRGGDDGMEDTTCRDSASHSPPKAGKTKRWRLLSRRAGQSGDVRGRTGVSPKRVQRRWKRQRRQRCVRVRGRSRSVLTFELRLQRDWRQKTSTE